MCFLCRTAEPPVSPPDPEDYERNVRNSCRHDVIAACYTIIDRLNELEPKGFKGTIHLLKELMDYMDRDMED